MFWKKSKDKQSPNKSSSSVTTVYRSDGGVASTGSAVTSYESKMKSSSKGSSSKTTITFSTKQTVSQKQNFSEVTRAYTELGSGSGLLSIDSPKWTLSSSNVSQSQKAILSRQMTEPSINIMKRMDATPFNSTYESPYRNADLPTLRTRILPSSTVTTATTSYQSPYRNTSATSSIRDKKTTVISPNRTKTSTIWNPISSVENTRTVYTPTALPAKTSNPPAKTFITTTTSSIRDKKTTVISPSRTVTSTATALLAAVPKTTKTSAIWNPISSVENTRTVYTPTALPAKTSNPPAKTFITTSISQPKVSTVKPPPVPVANAVIKPVNKKKQSPGVVYIFHNDKFDSPDKEFRNGSTEDVHVLKKTFQAFKMQVNLYNNFTVKEVDNAVRKIETKDYGNASCIVIVILTHGTRYETVAAKDDSYSIDDNVLFPILRNRSLRSKPKLLFIQACKGDMETSGFRKDAMQPNGPPDEILKCYSTFEGYAAYRTEKGSLFIQALCELLQIHGKSKNIKDIMDMVIRKVKDRSESKQIPSYETTLTESYIFGDYV